MKNKNQLDLIKADDTIVFAIQFLANMLNHKNEYCGMMLYEILRLFVNLSDIKQDFLVQAGILNHLSKVMRGKLIERLHMKQAQNSDEFCNYEKALAAKCLYPYAIHPQHSKLIFADAPLLQGINFGIVKVCTTRCLPVNCNFNSRQ